MILCPYCGAENTDSSAFCSLCLARFAPGEGANIDPGPPPTPSETRVVGQPVAPAQSRAEYVSPGDYRALVKEMNNGLSASAYDPFFRSSNSQPFSVNHPGVMSKARPPSLVKERSIGSIILLLLKHSITSFLLLFGVWAAIGSIFLRNDLSNSVTSWGIGQFLNIGLTVLVLILAGYRISAEAQDPGKGWIYGVSCVAVIMMVWFTLFVLAVIYAFTGKMIILIFEPAMLMMIIFLYLPMGALGGWIAEKRCLG